MNQPDYSLIQPEPSASTIFFEDIPPQEVILTGTDELYRCLPKGKDGEAIFAFAIAFERFGYFTVKQKDLGVFAATSFFHLHNKIVRNGRTAFQLFNKKPFVVAYL